MALDLDSLKELALSYGFSANSADDKLEVELPDGLTLDFSNADDAETVGIRGSEWHFHLPWLTEVGDGLFQEFDAEAVLSALAARELVVVEIQAAGVLTDRWLEHREGSIDLTELQSGEQLRARVAGGPVTSVVR